MTVLGDLIVWKRLKTNCIAVVPSSLSFVLCACLDRCTCVCSGLHWELDKCVCVLMPLSGVHPSWQKCHLPAAGLRATMHRAFVVLCETAWILFNLSDDVPHLANMPSSPPPLINLTWPSLFKSAKVFGLVLLRKIRTCCVRNLAKSKAETPVKCCDSL